MPPSQLTFPSLTDPFLDEPATERVPPRRQGDSWLSPSPSEIRNDTDLLGGQSRDDESVRSSSEESPAKFLGDIFLSMPPASPSPDTPQSSRHLYKTSAQRAQQVGSPSTPRRQPARKMTTFASPTSPSVVYDDVFLEKKKEGVANNAPVTKPRVPIPRTPYPPRKRGRASRTETKEEPREDPKPGESRKSGSGYKSETVASKLKALFGKTVNGGRRRNEARPAWRP